MYSVVFSWRRGGGGGGGGVSHDKAAGPESLEDYFQKGAHLALNLWYVNTRPNSQKLLPFENF